MNNSRNDQKVGRLLTPELIKQFAEVGKQDVEDPIVVAKFFNPCGAGTWYATAYDPEANLLFCYVAGLGFDEWGYASLAELEALECPPFNLPIERDLYFEERRFSEIREVNNANSE